MNRQEGFTLSEILVAMVILGTIGAAILSGLYTSTKTTSLADERSTAQNLAERQMEYVRAQDYIVTNPGTLPHYLTIPDVNTDFIITTIAERLDPEGDGTDDDDGIQKITVIVSRGSGKQVTTLVDYKVRR